MADGRKIAILTLHDSDNFGSVLQAYATCAYLRSVGHDCEILDLRKPEVAETYSLLHKLRTKSDLAYNAYNLLHMRAFYQRKKAFARFRDTWIPLSAKRYANGREIAEDSERLPYDVYVVGSDQVWNTGIADFDEAYFLPFAKDKTKVAYAASFGPLGKKPEEICRYREMLEAFDTLSVRENTARDLLEQILPGKSILALDPVFLPDADVWRKLADKARRIVPKHRYMLCYFAGGVARDFEQFTITYAREHGLKRVLLSPYWKNIWKSGRREYATGPLGFLSLVMNAEVVCTNSFHGTAFSILFRKQFVTYSAPENKDSRIETILSALGLRQTVFSGDGTIVVPFDFDAVERTLAERREESRHILKFAIEGDR